MSELKNFPFKNQLNEPDIDGVPDVNAGMNCLPTCIASALQYLNGKQYTGEEIEHQVYGNNYKGGTAAVSYVSWVAKQGVTLKAISSSNRDYLVQQVHAQLALGHPVIATIPSSYQPPANPMNPGESHCIVFYKDSPGVLIAMNPWTAFAQSFTDAQWAARFCYGQVWPMYKGASMSVPNGWKDPIPNDPNGTLVATNGKACTMGFRAWVLAHEWRADDVPLNNAYGWDGGTRQDFLYEYLTWTSKGGVQSNAYGSEYLQAVSTIQTLQSQIKTLQDQLKNQPTAPASNDTKALLTALDQALQGVISKL